MVFFKRNRKVHPMEKKAGQGNKGKPINIIC